MNALKIADFRDRVTLLASSATVDSELNRIETVAPVKTVWANVKVKNSVIDSTPAGTRPEIRYTITIRKQKLASYDHVAYKGRVLKLTAPAYEVDNKYIVFEAVETVGKECKLTTVPEGCLGTGAASCCGRA